jgi:hypothetical protein
VALSVLLLTKSRAYTNPGPRARPSISVDPRSALRSRARPCSLLARPAPQGGREHFAVRIHYPVKRGNGVLRIEGKMLHPRGQWNWGYGKGHLPNGNAKSEIIWRTKGHVKRGNRSAPSPARCRTAPSTQPAASKRSKWSLRSTPGILSTKALQPMGPSARVKVRVF